MLREIWRVLEPEGRLIVVVPNRTSPWAYLERTPFGHGQPYTPSQLGRLLKDCLFHVERHDTALVLPPVVGATPGLARIAERVRRAMPRMSGVIMVEAVKDVAGVVPLRAQRRRLLLAVPA
jgi:SAM-dependent methyltransferase